jgi:hypothetical protein
LPQITCELERRGEADGVSLRPQNAAIATAVQCPARVTMATWLMPWVSTAHLLKTSPAALSLVAAPPLRSGWDHPDGPH